LVFVTYVSDVFCRAGYNARRQRVLAGKTPNQVVAERLTAKPPWPKTNQPDGPGRGITKARLTAESAKGVSQPDNITRTPHCWHIRHNKRALSCHVVNIGKNCL